MNTQAPNHALNHALLIGSGGDLPNTIDDAQGLAQILRDPARCAFDPANVKVLTEREAGRNQVLAALDQLAQDAAPDSTVILYFSGHGGEVKSSVGKIYFLMPFGYDMQNLAETAISGREFADKLGAIPAQRLLLLLDCCHARGVAEESTQAKAGLSISKSPIPPEAEKLFAQGAGKIIIASSKAEQYSFTGKPYSLFTRALIEGLCGADVTEGDGFVRAADLAMYAREKVSRWSRGKQQPMFDVQKADNFRVAYYAGGEAKPKGLTGLGLPPINEDEIAQQNTPSVQINQSGGINFGVGNTTTINGDVVGGNKIDARGSQGANIGNTGTVNQHFGDSINVGDINHSSGVAIGRGAKANVEHGAQYNFFIGDRSGSAPPVTARGKSGQRKPIPIRLDVAAPKTATINRGFDLAVAIRQPSSPPLAIADLQHEVSVTSKVWSSHDQNVVKYRVELVSTECDIPQTSYTFLLQMGEDSPAHFFKLIPRKMGPLSIIVNAYQVADNADEVVANTRVSISVEMDVAMNNPQGLLSNEPEDAEDSFKQRLYAALTKAFNLNEMADLAFQMGLNWESLSGDTLEAKARECVNWCERNDKLTKLKQLMLKARPNLRNKLS